MPTDPFRLRVKKALTERFKAITPANGYVNDLSDFQRDDVTVARVYRGRDQFGFNDPRPMVSILEHPSALDALLAGDASSDTVGYWELLIQGFVADDPENPTDLADTLAADVVKCLAAIAQEKKVGDHMPTNILGFGSQRPCINPNGKGVLIGKPVVRPADGEVSDVAQFYLSVRLSLVEDTLQPFD